MKDGIVIRAARSADVEGIVALINEYAAEKIMLARTPASVELTLQDFVVASDARGRMLAFFEAVGYGVSDRARYPEKIRRDCVSCLRRFACPEVCVTRSMAAPQTESLAVAA
jgi:N-acetylglutamate synthase-like GNAT family acetyltransferase